MIRRADGDHWLLIAEADAAAVAARLAGHVGHRAFGRVLSRRASLLAAVAAHEAGWQSHDAAPTLDGRGRPLDAVDAPYPIALPAWSASTAAAAADAGPWAGLLVSVMMLSRSIYAAGPRLAGHAHFDLSGPHATFAVNQFQHREIERQEQLRAAVGLPTDIPLTHGLADAGTNDGDDHLAYGFRLLSALSRLARDACAGGPPTADAAVVLPMPGASPRRLSVTVDGTGVARVRPWPFDVARLELAVPCRRVPARPFGDVSALRDAYAAAPVERLPVVLRG